MKKILAGKWTRVLSFALLMVICSGGLAEVIYKDDGSGGIDIEQTFDWDLYEYYIQNGFQSATDLVNDFNSCQMQWLPLVPPGIEIFTQPTGIRYFPHEGFPKKFIEGLLSVALANSAIVWPVIVREDPTTRKRVFRNIKGETIWTANCPKDYDESWYLLEQYPDIYSGAYSKEEIALLEEMYSTSKLAIRYDLILEDDLVKYILTQSIEAAPVEEVFEMMKSSWTGGSVTNLKFVAVDRTNGMIELTIAWPTNGMSTNMVDFFACTNLMEQDWSIVATTNVNLSTNNFSWIDENSTNFTVRFYDCWTLYDGDSDGISDGREVRLYPGLDPDDWDTDDDGVGDGAELFTFGTDPVNIHNSLLPYSTGFESSNSYSIGTLNSQNGWESDAEATIQSGIAHAGDQAVELEALEATMTKHFATTNNSVTTELFVCLGQQFSVPTNLPTTASSLVSYEAGTGIRAFNGNGSGGGSWSTASGTTNLLNQWVELKIVQNYSAHTWSLYVDDSLKLSSLGFKNNGVTQLEAMHIRSGIGGAVICDDVIVSSN